MTDQAKRRNAEEFTQFCRDIQYLEQRALKLNLYVTARALNAAVRAAGWEQAGDRSTALKRAQDRLSQDAGAPP